MRRTLTFLLLAAAGPALAQSVPDGKTAPSPAPSVQSTMGLNNRVDQPSPETTGAIREPVPVSRLLKAKVRAGDGTALGEVERVVQDDAGKRYIVVVTETGFLGPDKRILLPAEQVASREGGLTAPELDEQQSKRLPPWDRLNRAYRDVEGGATVEIARQG